MVNETQITDKLKRIDQTSFGRLVDGLLYAGAFHDIVPKHSFVESFGVNIDKQRTVKSAPFADTEIQTLDIKVESSVEVDWAAKFKREVAKYEGREVATFLFCTNQDTKTKRIRDGKKSVSAIDYAKSKIKTQNCIILGQRDLVGPLLHPDYFHVRRMFLDIEDDFLCSPAKYLEILRENPSFATEVASEELEGLSKEVESVMPFSPGTIYVLHSSEYITLLHSVGIWAEKALPLSEEVGGIDYSFARWPNSQTSPVPYEFELSKDAPTFVMVWRAHELENLSDHLVFHRKNGTIVFICQTGFLEGVVKKIRDSSGNIEPKVVTVASLDKREITPSEISVHEQKIDAFVKDTSESVLKLEALVYMYSPLRVDDKETQVKMAGLLKMDVNQLLALRQLLVDSDLASITGDILWLKQSGIARTLLDKYTEDGTFDLEQLLQ